MVTFEFFRYFDEYIKLLTIVLLGQDIQNTGRELLGFCKTNFLLQRSMRRAVAMTHRSIVPHRAVAIRE